MVGTHPFPSWHGGEGRVKTVHVEEKGTVITLDKGGHPAAPVIADGGWGTIETLNLVSQTSPSSSSASVSAAAPGGEARHQSCDVRMESTKPVSLR